MLRGVPVPPRADPRTTLTFWQRTLGYSYLFDFILRRLDLLHDWFGDHLRVHAPGTGERLACRLTDRLADLQRRAARACSWWPSTIPWCGTIPPSPPSSAA